jgi:hypothetical protein
MLFQERQTAFYLKLEGAKAYKKKLAGFICGSNVTKETLKLANTLVAIKWGRLRPLYNSGP